MGLKYLSVQWEFYTSRWNGSFIPLDGMGVLYLSVEWEFYTSRWNGSFIPLGGMGVLYLSVEWEFYTTRCNGSFIRLGGMGVLYLFGVMFSCLITYSIFFLEKLIGKNQLYLPLTALISLSLSSSSSNCFLTRK